jgi:hypothetical protein
MLVMHSACCPLVLQQVAAYENLLRKIMLKAPNAALLSFAAFAWKIDEVGDEPPYTSVPNPFWNTGECELCKCGCSNLRFR